MYCTIDEIKKLLPEDVLIQLTDDEALKPSVIDPQNAAHIKIMGRIDETIETADAEINGYCAVKYAVPLSPVPAIVNKLSVELAIYYLYSRRTVPEAIEKRYEKAIARLKDIARGIIVLAVDPPAPASTTADSARVNKSDRDRIFTRDTLKGF